MIYGRGPRVTVGTEFDSGWGMGLHGSKVNREHASSPDPNTADERDRGPDDQTPETPETPLDEPRPPRVQDPPPQPDQKGPYVVRMQCR